MDGRVITTTDMTSSKILDRSAPITALTTLGDGGDDIAVVFDESRVLLYSTLQKESLF